MEIKKIKESIYFLENTTNIPMIYDEKGFILFDSPIDKDKAKKVRKLVNEKGFKPKFLILSHHHADHTGGASYLKETYNATLFASQKEKPFIEFPMIEPIYLSQGSSPPEEFLGKWVKSTEVTVDIILDNESIKSINPSIEVLDLSGHSIGMIGIKVENVIFPADAFFSTEILQKYIVPYFHDKDKYIEKMHYLKSIDFEYILPSHGKLYRKEEAIKVIDKNIEVVEQIEENIINSTITPKTIEEIIQTLNIPVSDFVVAFLIRSSVQSIINSLLKRGLITAEVENCIVRFAKNF